MKLDFYGSLPVILLITGIILQTGCRKGDESPYGPGWSAVHADGLNSDYSNVKGAKKLNAAWQRKFDGTINLGATTDKDGRVYITTSAPGCHLYALDSRSGETIWCSEEVNRYAVASAPLIDREGRIFLADDEAMHAFDKTGRLLWERAIKGFPLSAQFTQTGRLIFITHIGNVYVLDRTNGLPMIDGENLSPGHTFDTGFDPKACMKGTEDCPCANTLAFDTRSGLFTFTYWKPGTNQAALWCMQYLESPNPSIHKIWENNSLPGGSASSPDISADGSRVYVNDNEGNLYAMKTADGSVIWKHAIGFDPGGSQSTSPEGYIMPAGANGAALMCIRDLGDRAETVWSDQSLHNRGIATQARGGLAYVTVGSATSRFENDLIVVDVLSGKELDRDPLPGQTFFTVGTTVGPEGNVYVPTFNGLLFAFKPN
jgi:outer membrane protein assembly factor BamB